MHGRSVVQLQRPSNWDFLAAVKRHAGDRIVLGSGDLFGTACVSMLTHTGVDGVDSSGALETLIFQQSTIAKSPRRHSAAGFCRNGFSEHFRLAVELHGDNLPGTMRKSRSSTPNYTQIHSRRNAFIAAKTWTIGRQSYEILRQGWAQRSFRISTKR